MRPVFHGSDNDRHAIAAARGNARAAGVEMPIAECVVALLDGRLQAADAVARLMEREPTVERH